MATNLVIPLPNLSSRYRKILKKNVANIVSAVRVHHPIASSILSPVRVLHLIAQALCRPSECSNLSRKHSVARQSTPSNHIKYPVARQSTPSNHIKHPVARQSAPSYRASTLSPVRVFHTFAQTLCRPLEHSIHSRKHSVARQSTPSNHIKHPVAHQNAIRRRRSKICNDFRIFDDKYSQKKRPEL